MNKKIDGDIAPNANLEHLKKQAKSLLRQAKDGNPHAVSRLVRSKAIEGKPKGANKPLQLADAQLAIARENGSATWSELKLKVETVGSPATEVKSQASIQGIDQIWLDCTDLEETEQFYTKLLGFRKSDQVPGQMLFFDCDGTTLLLGRRNETRPNSILYFKIGNSERDIQDAYNRLKNAGVSMGDSPHCIAKNWSGFDVWIAFFSDPSGNDLAFKCDVPVSTGS